MFYHNWNLRKMSFMQIFSLSCGFNYLFRFWSKCICQIHFQWTKQNIFFSYYCSCRLWKVDLGFQSRIDHDCSGSNVFGNQNRTHCLSLYPHICFAKDFEIILFIYLFFFARYLLCKEKGCRKFFCPQHSYCKNPK